jgi:hypothetical protein
VDWCVSSLFSQWPLVGAWLSTLDGMTSPIPQRVRQAIIEFSGEPHHGDVARFCAAHGISRAVFYRIRAAASDDPVAAISPRSTAPTRPAGRTPPDVEQQALDVRADLIRQGCDIGALLVASTMRTQGMTPLSRATLARIFTRNGVVNPEPKKRPRSVSRRFRCPDPNGCWQLDSTDYRLDSGAKRCVPRVEDDHSRKILASRVARSENSDDVLAVVDEAISRHGAPARFLTDNGAAFNLSRRGPKPAWNGI